jgi:hypothetical protein
MTITTEAVTQARVTMTLKPKRSSIFSMVCSDLLSKPKPKPPASSLKKAYQISFWSIFVSLYRSSRRGEVVDWVERPPLETSQPSRHRGSFSQTSESGDLSLSRSVTLRPAFPNGLALSTGAIIADPRNQSRKKIRFIMYLCYLTRTAYTDDLTFCHPRESGHCPWQAQIFWTETKAGVS